MMALYRPLQAQKYFLLLVSLTVRAWFQLTERDLKRRRGGLLRIFIKMQISGSMTLSPAYLGMADFTGA